MILGIDPGYTQSAWVYLDDSGRPVRFGIDRNEMVLAALIIERGQHDVVIEKIASMGMAVGEETFDTVLWSGRFIQAYRTLDRTWRLTRMAVKMHLCNSSRARDPNIRQALIDRFGGIVATKKGGVLHGVASDMWAALAVAVTHHDRPDLSQRLAPSLHREAVNA